MPDHFEVTKAEGGSMIVRHLAEGHLYTFHVVKDLGNGLVLGNQNMRENASAKHGGAYHSPNARAFAEAEARRLGMID